MKDMFRYVDGDATETGDKGVVIGHLCNDLGIWGAGFVLSLSERWLGPEEAYLSLWDDEICQKSELRGEIQVVEASESVIVVNMIAMDRINTRKMRKRARSKAELDRIDYVALRKCLKSLAKVAPERPIQMPMIGNGLAGGDWGRIEAMIQEELADRDVTIFRFYKYLMKK